MRREPRLRPGTVVEVAGEEARGAHAQVSHGVPRAVPGTTPPRRHSSRDGRRWNIVDEESARTAVADIAAQLNRAGWPVLEGMFSREAILARLRHGELGMMKRSNARVFFARAEALLLMDAGLSDALESQLEYALTNVNTTQREDAQRFDAWASSQAAEA